MTKDRVEMAAENAHLLAIKGLNFIIEDPQALARFMNLSGLSDHDIRAAAAQPEFLAGVLSFLMDHEAVLMAFAASAQIPPQQVAGAHLALSGAPVWDS